MSGYTVERLLPEELDAAILTIADATRELLTHAAEHAERLDWTSILVTVIPVAELDRLAVRCRISSV